MRIVTSIVMMLAWSSASAAQTVQMKDAVAALNASAKTKVKWDTANAHIADVNCDGRPDRIMFGVSDHAVWLGMVPSGGDGPQTIKFYFPSEAQNAFSKRPNKLNFYPLDCDTDAIGHLDGCKQIKGCKAFDLNDGDTDPFNFYWDSKHKRLSWWRN